MTEECSKNTDRVSVTERIKAALTVLRECRLGPFDLILEILNEQKHEFKRHRTEFYREENEKFTKILNTILATDLGKRKFRAWLQTSSQALELVCKIISDEMDDIHQVEQLSGLADITPDFLMQWSVLSHREKAPLTAAILLSAAQTDLAREKNKKKKPDMVCFPFILNRHTSTPPFFYRCATL